MQHMEQAAGWSGAERSRIEALVEKLSNSPGAGESLAEIVHDARNMVTALWLYCDLLEEPGVLATQFLHYGSELRLVAAASRRLVEKLAVMEAGRDLQAGSPTSPPRRPQSPGTKTKPQNRLWEVSPWDLMPAVLIENLSAELIANRNLLAALAGPSIALTVVTEACALPVWLTGEDLTRVLVNLVKNASEAMSAGGQIQLNLVERPAAPGASRKVSLTIEDSGPGFRAESLERIFEPGFSTQSNPTGAASWPVPHRGLGLSIARSIVEKAGGRIAATNRAQPGCPPAGARIAIELPVRVR